MLTEKIGFITLSAICITLVFIGLYKTGKKLNKGSRLAHTFLGIIIGWILLISILAIKGILSDFSSVPPKMGIVLLPPMIIAFYLTFSGKMDKILISTPQSWLIGIQSFRIAVEILLWLLFTNHLLPVQMTFEGLNWDILSGILGLVMLIVLRMNNGFSEAAILIYNLIGLMLLINIVTIAILSFPTEYRYFTNEPANRIVAIFPFVLLPGILVPLAYYLHFFSLRKFFLEKKRIS